MIKIKYDFKKVYDPATSISNTLTTGTTGLTEATTSIQNKKYIDVTATIMSIAGTTNENLKVNNAAGYAIGATAILFDNGGGSSVVDTGDYVKILNYWYLVDSVSWSVAGTSGTINLDSGLLEAIADDDFIYVKYPVTINFTNCLFVRCSKIFYSNDIPFGTVTFTNCTFNECLYIVDTESLVNSAVSFTSCISYKCLAIDTDCPMTMSKSCYTTFLNATDDTIIGSIIANPLFRDSNCVLMSLSRGDDYDSPCLVEKRTAESWTLDAGCWTETRDTTPADTNSELLINAVCDNYQKKISLTQFKKWLNENGDIVQFWSRGNERKTVTLLWSSNFLTQYEMVDYISMILAKDDYVEFYPVDTDATRYLEGHLIKVEEINASVNDDIFYDEDVEMYQHSGISGVKIEIIVDLNGENGTWQL